MRKMAKEGKFFFCLFIGFYISLLANLTDLYKKGLIKLIPDPEYGKHTDWSSLLYGQISNFTVARDGSLFVTSLRQDKVYKFDKDGDFVKTFGQKGQGPGDLQEPRDLSILDDKYLVVRESSTGRISLFDLEGKFVKIIQVGYSVLDCVSLKNNKIAILTVNSSQELETISNNYIVYIRDLSKGNDIKVDEFHLTYKREAVFIRGNYGSLYGSIHISCLEDGHKLLLGYSNDPEISIYSTDGKHLRSFLLTGKDRKKINHEMKNLFYKEAEERIKKQIRYRSQSLELLEKAKQDDVLPEYTPYYYDIIVDPEDHILVFKFFLFDINNKYLFQVYSPEGEFIYETKIDTVDHEPIGPALFHQGYAFGPFRKKNDEESFSFFRMKIQ